MLEIFDPNMSVNTRYMFSLAFLMLAAGIDKVAVMVVCLLTRQQDLSRGVRWIIRLGSLIPSAYLILALWLA